MSLNKCKKIQILELPSGKVPYLDWINGLKDRISRARIRRRLDRLEQGHYGDYKILGDGVNELRFYFGPGYRVYFVELDNEIIILLCGGDKTNQERDIKTAKRYWQELRGRLYD